MSTPSNSKLYAELVTKVMFVIAILTWSANTVSLCPKDKWNNQANSVKERRGSIVNGIEAANQLLMQLFRSGESG